VLTAHTLAPSVPRASGGGPSSGSVPAASGVDAELIAGRYRLKPFAPAPAAPAVKPVTLSSSDPPVFSRVPVTDKVVFVTIDDGIEKDPGFIQMVKDFQVPLTISLADVLIRDDYAYFEKLYQTGYVSIQNHTVTHPLDMPALSYAQQLDEISGQQERLRAEYGVSPYIFRPPGGNYNATTVEAVRASGLKGLMLWTEAMEISDMQYQTAAHRLNHGDIILCHFRGPAQLDGETMVRMMTRLYRHIQDQGFTIADITKYV
jgi:peptidoglycan/xylan/chitin deacetylase (PgdA/CDA1 family)